jgi:hypothetical protein
VKQTKPTGWCDRRKGFGVPAKSTRPENKMRPTACIRLAALIVAAGVHALPLALRRDVATATIEPLVESPPTNPLAMLDCLKRHRYTPLACNTSMMNQQQAASPPPLSACAAHAPGEICAYGRGSCAYDSVRGWHCRCVAKAETSRGMEASRSEAELQRAAPDCIDR